MRSDRLRVALVVGDTAGHTHPALAVADALRARESDAEILFFGTSDSVAASIVDRAGHAFVPVPGSPIRRADAAGLARAAWRTSQSIGVARRSLAGHHAQLAMGFGGFASGGVIVAARTLGLRTAILEANVEFGLANRWLRPWVDRVFLGLGSPQSSVAGVPVRSSVVSLADAPPRHPPQDTLRILVVSGSRGRDFFAEHLPPVLARLVSAGIRIKVRQQAAVPGVLREQYASLDIPATIEPFVEDIAGAYAWADVAIARGGASTIAELAIAGLPALLVPLADASANHQAANAELWQRAGAGIAIAERDWRDDVVIAWLHAMATDEPAWRARSRAARDLARPNAATHIAEECVRLIRRAP